MKFAGVLITISFLSAGCSNGSGGAAIAGGTESAAAATKAEAASAAAPAAVETPAKPPAPTFREVTLPAGTVLRVNLKSAVASDTSNVEDSVAGELRQAVVVKGQSVLPAGTEVTGVVTNVERAGRVKGRARIGLRFDAVRYQGERYSIQTAAIGRQAEASKREDATKIGIGAGAGAALGAILGGGSGAAKGAAIGGAGGTGVVLATRGKDVRLGPGADLDARLTAPVTIRVKM
jgi:hypothetical protein